MFSSQSASARQSFRTCWGVLQELKSSSILLLRAGLARPELGAEKAARGLYRVEPQPVSAWATTSGEKPAEGSEEPGPGMKEPGLTRPGEGREEPGRKPGEGRDPAGLGARILCFLERWPWSNPGIVTVRDLAGC